MEAGVQKCGSMMSSSNNNPKAFNSCIITQMIIIQIRLKKIWKSPFKYSEKEQNGHLLKHK